jgi:hypothetical protein
MLQRARRRGEVDVSPVKLAELASLEPKQARDLLRDAGYCDDVREISSGPPVPPTERVGFTPIPCHRSGG